MAVVKPKYTKKKGAIKANLRYITHRPGRDGERQSRSLFTRDGHVEKNDAYRLIDNAPAGTTFFKLILSPDPRREDTRQDLDLWRLSAATLAKLETRLGKPLAFIGVVHSDHTTNRHVHAIICLTGKLTRSDIQALRQAATEAALLQRRERELHHAQARRLPALHAPARRSGRARGPSLMFKRQNCPRCLSLTQLRRLNRTELECGGCGGHFADRTLSLAAQGVVWGL